MQMCGGPPPETQGPSEQERQTAIDAQVSWDTYKRLYAPGEQRLKESIDTMGENAPYAAGRANADVQIAGGRQAAGLRRKLTVGGTNGGAAVLTDADVQADVATAAAGATAGAEQNMNNRTLEGRLGMVAHGRKLQDDRELGTRTAAQQSLESSLSGLRTALTERETRTKAVNTLLDEGSGLLGMGLAYGAKKGWLGTTAQENITGFRDISDTAAAARIK